MKMVHSVLGDEFEVVDQIEYYRDAGMKVFGLYGIDDDGKCKCGNPRCPPQSAGKHPIIANWQNTFIFEDEKQFEGLGVSGHWESGFGVLCDGFLILDVDARNGGVESFKKLVKDCPAAGKAAFVVNTGSGGGSQHHYFKLSEKTSLVQTHKDYPGVDVKTSGFVVGWGSMHKSGFTYENERGTPETITEAPDELIEVFKRPDYYCVEGPNGTLNVTESEIVKVVSHISPDMDRPDWIRVGMAIHHSMGGLGFDIWDSWSAKSERYPGYDSMAFQWASFGRKYTGKPASYGTLVDYAQANGYMVPVELDHIDVAEDDPVSDLDFSGIDLNKPPGFAGEIVHWINETQTRRRRDSFSVATALSVISSVAGMSHEGPAEINIMCACIGGSGTGKEAALRSHRKLIDSAGLGKLVYNEIMSKQEIPRDLIRHQASFYNIDEFGDMMSVVNGKGINTASYHQGLIAKIMETYSKSGSVLGLSGTRQVELVAEQKEKIARINKSISDLPCDSSSAMKEDKLNKKIHDCELRIKDIEAGIRNPYLTFIGFSTLDTLEKSINLEEITKGFWGRILVFVEKDEAPPRIERPLGWRTAEVPNRISDTLSSLVSPGYCDLDADPDDRIEFNGDKTVIYFDKESEEYQKRVSTYFDELAGSDWVLARRLSGLYNRAGEHVIKVATILGIPDGGVKLKHVRYAAALIDHNIKNVINIQLANEGHGMDALKAKILTQVGKDAGKSRGVLLSRVTGGGKPKLKAEIEPYLDNALKLMADEGLIRIIETRHPTNKKKVIKYYGV